ncbi:alpha/beta hydrolase [Actinomadura algeriensis]|uniref:Pimeloyl-ACP methyl ester carboxylesterase n=1 Tax=Actinomadura algeriensis TaxID=1679523 RepID=A0ABR9JR61_9ACTN|nr:alpha/beta hydrolase [Actinomadura algeriensis]MBE1532904.1 pimeloyl-ACP methyl ester carboxylesterase [Actinomadura algeriensis]
MRAAKTIGATIALMLAAVTGCDGASDDATMASRVPDGLGAFYDQRPDWRDCGGGFQCATVQVPLDYAEPQGEKVGIAVIRLPAQNKSERIGSLFTNPGGPGGSGVDFVRQAAAAFGTDLRARFDIVGFDPRGVGESGPVRCNTTEQLDRFFATDTSPDDPSERETLATRGEQFADSCGAKEKTSLPHVGTADAARDMDVLRAALGDDKLTYYGASYGTYLGAFYAEQFPKNVRALVLDGAVDPRLSSTGILIEQAKGFETAFRAFADDCTAQPDCPLGTSSDAAVRNLEKFLAETDEKPLTARGDSRKVTESLATMGIAAALYAQQYWPTLRQGLAQAMQRGDGTILLTLADQMVDRKNGSYSNQTDANMAVNCVDKPNPRDVDAYAEAVGKAEKSAPLFGEFVVWGGLPCVYWPVQTDKAPAPVTAKGSAPVLVIGTTRDPATPYSWAESLAGQLQSGVLLTLDGDGHTAYLQANPCISRATDRYLVTTEPPKDGTVCR